MEETLSEFGGWYASWLWGIALILGNVLLHVVGLFMIDLRVASPMERWASSYGPIVRFSLVVGIVVLLLTVLHGVEGAIWALAYLATGALPNVHGAMLYSIGAITTYGNSDIDLAAHWRLLGALEALNGTLMFGLTTAFMFTVLQRLWPKNHPKGHTRE